MSNNEDKRVCSLRESVLAMHGSEEVLLLVGGRGNSHRHLFGS